MVMQILLYFKITSFFTAMMQLIEWHKCYGLFRLSLNGTGTDREEWLLVYYVRTLHTATFVRTLGMAYQAILLVTAGTYS